MSFKVIQKAEDLPQGPNVTVNIFAETKLEAHEYSNRHPSYQIFWIEEEEMGVWVSPIRRESDLK